MNDLIIPNQLPAPVFRNKSLSKCSRETYGAAVVAYQKFIQARKLSPGYESIREWLGTVKNPKTYNLKRQAITDYFLEVFKDTPPEKRLELMEGLKALPVRKPKHAIERTGYLTFEQFQELKAGLPDKVSLIVQALFWTGARISELIDIRVDDCIPGDPVTVRIRHGKGGRERQTYLPRELYDVIRVYFNGTDYLFTNHLGGPLDRHNVTREIGRGARRILGVKISAHTLRHSKAMYLKEIKKLTPDQIAKALGHSSVVTTLTHYFHGTPTAAEQGIY